jgi:hypothetical protein
VRAALTEDESNNSGRPMNTLNVSLQVLHLLCAILWFGSLIYTELILWPRMRRVGMLAAVQGELRSFSVRKLMAIAVVGTVVLGFARGAAGGVFARLATPYGIMFVLAAIVGTSMVVWWSSFPTRDRVWSWRLYYSGFWVLFALMIGMRFTG